MLQGSLVFDFPDGETQAPAETTVFVPAGTPHTNREREPSRYLFILTPRLDRLILELHSSPEGSRLAEILARFVTEQVQHQTRGVRQERR